MLWIVLLWGFCSLFFSKIPNKPPPGTIFRKRFGRFFLRKSSNMNTTTTTPCCNSAAVVHRYLLLVSVITEKSERLHTYQYMNIHGLYKNRCQVLVHNNNYTGVWFWSPHFTTTVYQVLPFRQLKIIIISTFYDPIFPNTILSPSTKAFFQFYIKEVLYKSTNPLISSKSRQILQNNSQYHLSSWLQCNLIKSPSIVWEKIE